MLKVISRAQEIKVGELFSKYVFGVPPFQRSFSWNEGNVAQFWKDIENAKKNDSSYFLGLIVFSAENKEKSNAVQIVDGQQRMMIITLLSFVIYESSIEYKRKALAEKINNDFLRQVNYDSDLMELKLKTENVADNATLNFIFNGKKNTEGILNHRLLAAFDYIKKNYLESICEDHFRMIGEWAEFVGQQLYFIEVVHPDSESAFKVYEIINNRGLDLTQADLLKNHVVSLFEGAEKIIAGNRWVMLERELINEDHNIFTQYIRHVITLQRGHVLPKDIFEVIKADERSAVDVFDLMEQYLPLYLQLSNSSKAGPLAGRILSCVSTFNHLGVVSVRPIILALIAVKKEDALPYIEDLLKLIVMRMVVGNIGTGNIERIFGESARKIYSQQVDEGMSALLRLKPSVNDFREKIVRRSFKKSFLLYLKKSIQDSSLYPDLSLCDIEFIAEADELIKNSIIVEPDDIRDHRVLGNSKLVHAVTRESIDLILDEFLKDEFYVLNQWDNYAIDSFSNELIERAEIWLS
ncbi:hypothetical protein C8246_00780 [Paracidovorax avenae]|uniref:DUF262 domain-containing protein n=1 Tax=Paracidovorax avenae TaxID=80867 RepID=UPI000D22884B|nr:DUF262 domain-containing protein [Paracidovorax avenae]AVS90638.1 hypothetical protein C8246_00780 [Paracidovorax avenae]AVS99341.1 hypothetical protein C8236_11265 [Paracidovorax avenae]AVT06325.1 hypothetical protein C8248_10445 [Paracidovorax avenae]